MPPLGDATVTAYWNTAGVSPGNYDVTLVLSFPPNQKTVRFSVSAGLQGAQVNEPGRHTARWVSLGVAAFAVLAYLLITFIKRRREP